MDEYAQTFDEGKKPKRLRQKDIQAILEKRQEGTDKSVSVWYRPANKMPLENLSREVSLNAAMTFSEVWKKQLVRSPDCKMVEVRGVNKEAYKRLLDWIDLCIDEGNDVKFPDIDENEHQLHVLLDVINAANWLGIPEGSLQAGLKKRGPGYARKHLIDMDRVKKIYNPDDQEYNDDLQEIAAISIFEAWWIRILDQPEFHVYESCLKQSRVELPKLDEDLHDQFNKKKEFISGKREEKKRLRDAEASAALSGGGMGADEGWDSAAVLPAAVKAGDGDGLNDAEADAAVIVDYKNSWTGVTVW